MITVTFHDTADDAVLQIAVIVTKSYGKWVFCKHKDRATYEVPAGHREADESILHTARRELEEETGAVDYTITPVCAYSVKKDRSTERFGMLFAADIKKRKNKLEHEIEKVVLSDTVTDSWTYPIIQPQLVAEVERRGYFS